MTGNVRSHPRFHYLILMLVALGGVGVVLFSTTAGVGLSVDSASYIETARNLAAGRGYVTLSADGTARKMIHFPPFFPVLLATATSLGVDAQIAARWLNAFLMFANTL